MSTGRLKMRTRAGLRWLKGVLHCSTQHLPREDDAHEPDAFTRDSHAATQQGALRRTEDQVAAAAAAKRAEAAELAAAAAEEQRLAVERLERQAAETTERQTAERQAAKTAKRQAAETAERQATAFAAAELEEQRQAAASAAAELEAQRQAAERMEAEFLAAAEHLVADERQAVELLAERAAAEAADKCPASVCLSVSLRSPWLNEQADAEVQTKHQQAEHLSSSLSGSSLHSPTAHASLVSSERSLDGSSSPTASAAPATAGGDDDSAAAAAAIASAGTRSTGDVGASTGGTATAGADETAPEWTQCSLDRALQESGLPVISDANLRGRVEVGKGSQAMAFGCSMRQEDGTKLRLVLKHSALLGMPSTVLHVLGLVESSKPGTGYPIVWVDEEGRQQIRRLLGFVALRMTCDLRVLLTASTSTQHTQVAVLGSTTDVGQEIHGGRGTPNYKSPEMDAAKGSKIKVDFPGDIYCMGQGLLEMWTAGTSVFGLGGHQDALLFRWLFDPRDRVYVLEDVDGIMTWALAQLPGELPTLVHRCLSLDPVQRPAAREDEKERLRAAVSAAAAAEELEETVEERKWQADSQKWLAPQEGALW
ncbi:hypothetical protein FOA52_014328 [Chlamydomonas sp. UWO 241]|nr:hypothetical protein FOA52_014328 [Chlamydomonas sp. UWO 241]